MRGRRALKAVALAGSLVVSACAVAVALALPAGWWLTWFALVPLFLSIRMLGPLRAMLAGAFWGLSVYVLSVTAVDTAVSATPASLALLVATPAVYTFFASLLTRWIGFAPLVLACGWMGVELALAPLGLRGGLLASALGDGLLAHSVGRLFGYVLIAFLIAGANASVLAVLSHAHFRVPSEGFLIGLPDAGEHSVSRLIFCASVLLLREAHPRAPPLPA